MSAENIVIITRCITAVAAVFGLIVAVFGLSTWKKQLRGTADYELSKRLMLQVYQLRDALQAARNPILSKYEGDKDDKEDEWQITAYRKRWDVVRNILSEFYLTSLEAEVVWDENTKAPKKSLLDLVHELNFALEMFITYKRDNAFADDFHNDYEKTIYNRGNDSYTTALNKAVKQYEKILKSYFRK